MKREGMAASFNSVFDRHGETVFWFALVMYVASFFLPSVYANDEFGRADPMRGYSCAYFSLGLSYAEIRGRLTEPATRDDRRPLVETISLLVSGLVNPTFLSFAATSRFRRSGAVAHSLRIPILLLLSFSCIFFVVDWHLFRPREGYFVWLDGIVLALFSCNFKTRLSGPIQAAGSA
jgi:hypothetical protein